MILSVMKIGHLCNSKTLSKKAFENELDPSGITSRFRLGSGSEEAWRGDP
jgi:hypothetical protein